MNLSSSIVLSIDASTFRCRPSLLLQDGLTVLDYARGKGLGGEQTPEIVRLVAATLYVCAPSEQRNLVL